MFTTLDAAERARRIRGQAHSFVRRRTTVRRVEPGGVSVGQSPFWPALLNDDHSSSHRQRRSSSGPFCPAPNDRSSLRTQGASPSASDLSAGAERSPTARRTRSAAVVQKTRRRSRRRPTLSFTSVVVVQSYRKSGRRRARSFRDRHRRPVIRRRPVGGDGGLRHRRRFRLNRSAFVH